MPQNIAWPLLIHFTMEKLWFVVQLSVSLPKTDYSFHFVNMCLYIHVENVDKPDVIVLDGTLWVANIVTISWVCHIFHIKVDLIIYTNSNFPYVSAKICMGCILYQFRRTHLNTTEYCTSDFQQVPSCVFSFYCMYLLYLSIFFICFHIVCHVLIHIYTH